MTGKDDLDELKRQRDEFSKAKTDARAQYLLDGDLPKLNARERHYDEQITKIEAEINRLTIALQSAVVSFAPGVVIDGYTLVERLGAGGNGEVWKVMKTYGATPRLEAMKILLTEHITTNEDKPTEREKRFLHEMGIIATLTHDHIVTVHTSGKVGRRHYVVMAYIDGNALSQKTKGKAHSIEQVVSWLEQIASALDYAHTQGIVHRDVKPDNILRRVSDGRLFLADFGLVFSDSGDAPRISESGTKVGTTHYMAPEQISTQHGTITRQTDVYALGITAYELLTGRLPFDYPDKEDVKEAHRYQDLPEDVAHIPPEVLAILQRACAKSSQDRYASAREFVETLANWQADPENLNRLIAEYLADLREALKERMLDQRFVDELGDQQQLAAREAAPVRPKRRSLYEYDDDDDDDRTVQTQADHMPADPRLSAQPIGSVREHLHTVTRAVLVGKPGSGKTYMLNRLALDLCRQWTAGNAAAKVPVVIKLNSFNGMDGEQPLPFSQYVRAEAFELAPYLRQLIRDGRVMLLCDALNEMPTTSADGRDLLKEVNDYLKDVPYFAVSCRIEDYRDHLIPLHPLEQVTLRDLELPAIREFFERYLGAKAADLWEKIGGSALLDEFWQAVNAPERNDGERFWNLEAGAPSYTSSESDAAWRTMHSGARLIPLCRNPFMGKLVSELYKATGQIPANRSRLFAGFADSLLQREQTNAARRKLPFPVLDHIHATLTDFARALQAGKVTTLPDAELPTPLDPAHLKAASQANIVLHEGGRWRFSHQLLQEYYAARVLLAAVEEQADPTATLTALGWDANEWWEAGVWRETLVLLGEMPGGPNAVAEWLAPASPELALQVVLRNADNAPLSASAKQALIDGANAHTAEPDPRGRAAAYRVLGHPAIDADHRQGIGNIAVQIPLPKGEGFREGLLPDFDWVTIPAGKFIYQQEKEPRTLPAFKISRYPVTYHQFQAFIDDPDGFYNPEWWEGLADDQYRRENQSAPGDQAFKYWNHPRENVSWYDAIAFCRWLSWRLSESPVGTPNGASDMASIFASDKWPTYDAMNPATWRVRLPTEFEWERAARGTQGLIYPYGNEFDAVKGNTDATKIGQTSAVGIFPDGASPDGVLDMSGNVWQWCLSEYGNPVEDSANENIRTANSRGLRGGAWYRDGYNARAVARNRSLPYTRDSLGFRVVVCRPS